jgi:hypothetical protein
MLPPGKGAQVICGSFASANRGAAFAFAGLTFPMPFKRHGLVLCYKSRYHPPWGPHPTLCVLGTTNNLTIMLPDAFGEVDGVTYVATFSIITLKTIAHNAINHPFMLLLVLIIVGRRGLS